MVVQRNIGNINNLTTLIENDEDGKEKKALEMVSGVGGRHHGERCGRQSFNFSLVISLCHCHQLQALIEERRTK